MQMTIQYYDTIQLV